MRQADLISAGILAVGGVVTLFVVIPIAIPGHGSGEYGLPAQGFPNVTAIMATALATGFFFYRLLVNCDESGSPPLVRRNFRFLAVIASLLSVAFILFDMVGFAAGAPVVVAGFMILMGERRPLPLVLMAGLLPLGIWLFFWVLLRFPLP